MAMEEEFGRHRAEVKTLAGVYGAAYEGDEGFAAIQKRVEALLKKRAAARACWLSRWARTGMTRGAR